MPQRLSAMYELVRWKQHPGEDNRSYVLKWRSNALAIPRLLQEQESLVVESCKKSTTFAQDVETDSFLSLVKKAVESPSASTSSASQMMLFFIEAHADYIKEVLATMGGTPYAKYFARFSYPETIGWPMIKLFHEGEQSPIDHLFTYIQVVGENAFDEGYLFSYFPFSLASGSDALVWYVSLSHHLLWSWGDLMGAFVSRFHDYPSCLISA